MMNRFVVLMVIILFVWPTAPALAADPFDACAKKKNVVENESPLPHGTQHMRVQGKCTVVAEPTAVGESMFDSPSDLELEGHYPMLPALFPKVIRDTKRDLFGPWQGFNGKKSIHFVFLRYHRLSTNPNGPHAVQAGEAVVPRRVTKGAKIRIAWEPPHRTERFPWCYLLSWDPGKKLLYRCLEAPTEPGGNMQRETKREFRFAINAKKTKEFTFVRDCPTAAPDDACSVWRAVPLHE